jgi:hypothetical protein
MQQASKEDFLNKIITMSIDDNESIKLIQIINSPIPKSIKHCFVSYSENLFKQYNFFNFGSDHFDFTAYDVRKSISNLEKHIKENTILTRDKYLEILKYYFQLQYDFLCKPVSTLSNFIFKDSPDKPVSEILADFKNFIDYTYYSEVLSHYIEEKKIEVLSKNEFISIIEKINSAVIKRLSIEEIAWMPRPISDFFNQIEPVEQVDIDLMIGFYEDIQIQGIADALKLEKSIRGRESINFEEIHKIISKIDDIFDIKLENIKQPQVETDKNTEPVRSAIQVDKTKSAIESSQTIQIEEETIKPEINFSESRQNPDSLSEMIESSDEVIENDYFVPVKADERFQNIHIPNEENKKNETTIQKKESVPAKDFDPGKYFSTNEEKLFIKKLFKKKHEYFQTSVNRIAASDSWEVAAKNIDHIFTKYDIDPFSKYALEFTNKIQSIYLTKEKNDN